MRKATVIAAFLVVSSLSAEVRVDPVLAIPITAELVSSATVRKCFADVLARSGYGLYHREEAAFLTMTESGEYGCMAWPSHFQHQRTTYRGSMPNGTVAIVHNHPVNLPLPSSTDRRVARSTGAPVFVVTTRNVSAVMPDGKVVEFVQNPRWAEEARRARP